MTVLRRLIFTVWISFICSSSAPAQNIPNQLFNQEQSIFRAACVKVDITPDKPQWLLGYKERRSVGVHDKLYHRVVAMDDGKTQFFLISSDVCVISPSFHKELCKELESRTGIKAEQVWWTVTHTHSAPEAGPRGLEILFLVEQGRYSHEPNAEYSRRVINELIKAVKQARSELTAARLGVGTGTSMANVNRRQRNPDGTYRLGVNPDGPVDRQIGLIRLERADGSPLALIANYAVHGTALGSQNLLITADVPGVVAEYVEQKFGAPMLFIQGAMGNIAPIYGTCPDFESSHITEFNALLADRILAANQSIHTTTSDVILWTGKTVIETPRKEGLGWVDDLADYTRTTSSGTKLVRIPVCLLKINDDIAIWAAPLELFCEIAMNIRNKSPFPFTFYFGLTNGTLMYLPTKQAFVEGGYEPSVSPFTELAEQDFTQGVISYLQRMRLCSVSEASTPKYMVKVEHNVRLPMRDGVHLCDRFGGTAAGKNR